MAGWPSLVDLPLPVYFLTRQLEGHALPFVNDFYKLIEYGRYENPRMIISITSPSFHPPLR